MLAASDVGELGHAGRRGGGSDRRAQDPPAQPGRFTERFFLDEAVELADGRRPSFERRRVGVPRRGARRPVFFTLFAFFYCVS